MRIGIDGFLLARPGGVGGYISSLIEALARYDHENDYTIYASPSAGNRRSEPGDRTRFHYVRLTDFRACRILWQQLFMNRRILKDGIDLLHCPSYVAPLRCNAPVVLTLHDVIALKHPRLCGRANAIHYRRILPRAAKKAKLIIASSETTRRDILEHIDLPEDKIRVIYPGIDSIFHQVDDERQLRYARELYRLPDKFILFVGNIEPKKGLDVLIEAYAQLRREINPPHRLVIAGAPLRGVKQLNQRIVEAGIAKYVVFTGRVPRGDLPSLYSLADLFVFPSLYEGFGFPPLEAMACGTPVVCSDGGSLPEVAGDAALISRAGDAGELRLAVAKALGDNTLRDKLIVAGRARAAAFDWRRSVEELLAAYRDAVKN